jgi:hypothetical protein
MTYLASDRVGADINIDDAEIGLTPMTGNTETGKTRRPDVHDRLRELGSVGLHSGWSGRTHRRNLDKV